MTTTAGTVAKAVERANDLRSQLIDAKQREDHYWKKRHALHDRRRIVGERLQADIAAIDEWRALGEELAKLGEPPGYHSDRWREWEEARDEVHMLMCDYFGLDWTITDEDIAGPF